LSPQAREALAQMSVFEGGATLDAAEGVLRVPGAWAVDLLQELVDASLVQYARSGDRFVLPAVVRDYAAEKIDPGARAAAHERHATFFAQLGSPEALAAIDAYGGAARLREVATEGENLLAAARRAIVAADGTAAVGSALAARAALQGAGRLAELLTVLRGALAIAPLDRHLAVMLALGDVLADLERLAEARAVYEDALARARSTGDRTTEGIARLDVGRVALTMEHAEDARENLEAAVAILRETGDRRAESIALGNLCMVHRQQGRMDEARACGEAAVERARAARSRRAEGFALVVLGVLHKDQGRGDAAGGSRPRRLGTGRPAPRRGSPRRGRRCARRGGGGARTCG
jgi:tetratricopeptide (TPR) repeat protein